LRKHPPQNEQRCFLRTNGLNREFNFKGLLAFNRYRLLGFSIAAVGEIFQSIERDSLIAAVEQLLLELDFINF